MLKRVSACTLCKSCTSCMYSDGCGVWNSNEDPIPEVVIDVNDVTLVLCRGERYKMRDTVDGAIFNETIDPTHVDVLEQEAYLNLLHLGVKHLNLYVTWLPVALIAVLNAAKKLDISVTLYHYDRETNTYYTQDVL